MRRRPPENPASLLFNGKMYATEALRDQARAAWRERRRRLLELATHNEEPTR